MTDITVLTIDQLPTASHVATTDLIPLLQGGVTKAANFGILSQSSNLLPMGSYVAGTDIISVVQGDNVARQVTANAIGSAIVTTLPLVIQSGTGAVATTVQAEFRRLALTPQQFGVVGDGVTNDTVAWTAWSAAVEASASRTGYIPGGIYLIDSWSVTARGVTIRGASRSSVTLTNSVKIKARSTVTNFVTWESDDSYLGFVELDGNNKATNVLRMANQTFDFAYEAVYVGGAVDSGVNVNLSGTTTNTQVAEGAFRDCFIFGSGSRQGTGATGITNIKINSNQSLVLSFFRCKIQGNDTNGTDVLEQVYIPLGTASFWGCFWTQGNASGHDVRIGDGGTGGGSVGLYDCRSESTLSDSIYCDGGSGDVALTNFTHSSTTKNTVNVTANFTGRVSVVGGQYYNVTNNSATAEVALFNHKLSGAYAGTYSNRICKLEAGNLQTRFMLVQAASGTMMQFLDTTNNKNFYTNWQNNVLTLFRDGPTELCNWDTNGVLTQQAALKVKDKIYPGTDAGATQTAAGLYAGSGVPNNANGSNGDFYFRSDGTQAGNTVIYHKQAGAWVALITT